MIGGRVTSFSFTSRVLAGNPPDDPVHREVWVWSPPGDAPTAGYPAIVNLIGFTGAGRMLLNDAPWSPGLGQRLDRLLAAGDIPPLVMVFPDCFTRYGGSQYVNSSATGRYEDYVCDEVVREVEARYPVRADRDHRFVYGKSSGGFGALHLVMQRPDLWGGAACISGDMGFEYGYLPDFPRLIAMTDKHGGLDGFLRAFDEAEHKTDDLIAAMNIVAMAACYSPDPRRPGAFDLPVDLPSGRLRPEVWERWLALDPVRRAANHLDTLRGLRALHLECGARDEFNLHLGARMLHAELEGAGVAHSYEEFDDGHMGIGHRNDVAIPILARGFPGAGRA